MERQVVIRPRLSFHDIYQYLIQKNFNLSSDRILKDPLSNADVIWNILVFLTNNLKDTKYDQT
jgi:tRNA A22 N-methylase